MNKKKRDIQQALIMVFEFSIHMIVPILLCTLVGVWIGKKTNLDWMVIPFFFIGALAGYTNIFKMTKRFLKTDKNPKHERQRDGKVEEGEDHVKEN